MSTPDTGAPTMLEATPAELAAHKGEHLGPTPWRTMTQERVNQFADVTEDHNFIHVDPERAAATPFGGTIAHGYLTVSLLAPLSGELMRVKDAAIAINYGMNKLRFPGPLPVGADFRATGVLNDVTEVPGGVQVALEITVEVRDAPKPSLVAECLYRFLT